MSLEIGQISTVKSEFVAAATITSDDFLVRPLIKDGCYLSAATIPTSIPIWHKIKANLPIIAKEMGKI